MMRRLLQLMVLLLLAAPVWGQGAFIPPLPALRNTGSGVVALPGALVTICASGDVTHVPCATPLINTVFNDLALTQPKTNPFFTDANGNISFAATPATYTVCVTVGVQGSCYQVTLGIGGGGSVSTGVTNDIGIYTAPTVIGDSGVPVSSVPLVPNDNIFTNNNRFKGPIPYRDITAYMPAGGCDQSTWNGVHQWGNMVAGSPNITLTGTVTINNGCGIFVGNAGAVSTLTTPARGSAPVPAVFGVAGTTTVNYEIVAIDKNYGTSAASAPITVTTANATRSAFNYVAIWWTSVANAVGYLVYTDQGTGVYVPLVQSFNCSSFLTGNVCGALDKGPELNSFTGFNSLWPLTPPASPTNSALITTVLSGGGTQNLVLAANAVNSVTQSGAYFPYVSPDVSMFLGAAIADAAADGTASNRGKVFIPEGRWVTSTVPYASNMNGVQIELLGRLNLFALPAGANVVASGGTGNVSFHGTGGVYSGSGTATWHMAGSQFVGQPSLGALILVNNGTLSLDHLYLSSTQAGIIQGSLGDITAQDITFFSWTSSLPMLQIDGNAFFSQWDRTVWDFGSSSSNTGIPALWFLGLTNNNHTSAFDFRNNSFISHTMRLDFPYTVGGPGYFGNPIKFDGLSFVENNYDLGIVVAGTCSAMQQVTFEDIQTGDSQNPNQSFFYTNTPLFGCGTPQTGVNIFVRGQTSGNINSLAGGPNMTAPVTCRAWTYENPNQGGAGASSIGYWGNYFGKYDGCDNGITRYGYDLQTSEVLTSGGNDGFGPAGEQMIGHVFQRPFTTLITSTTGGSLSPGTYFIKTTMVDVAGRESATSPEVSIVVPAGTSTNVVNVSTVTRIFFPAACNVYFSTTTGTEAAFFQSATVTNGTCTFTLTTISGGTSRTPFAVGNAMRTWLTEENNSSSCLFCGNSNGGTGFLGINLNLTQYGIVPANTSVAFGEQYALMGSTSGSIVHTAPAIAGSNVITDPAATGTASLMVVEYCGATSGATQACAKTVQTNPIIIFGDVALNTATTQSITTLPFTSAASYSCFGSDLTTVTGIVSFNTYAAASVTIAESGGVNTDHLRFTCTGF